MINFVNLFWWLVVIVGYTLAIFIVIRTYIFAFSLFRDAPYVPYHTSSLKYAIDLLEINDKSKVIDIGSGDGVVVFNIANASKGVGQKYTGIEISRGLVLWSNFKKMFQKYGSKINFVQKDIFNFKGFKEYNRVFLYLTSNLASQVVLILLKELPKGSIIVSGDFDFNEEVYKKVKVEKVVKEEGKKKYKFFRIRL